MTGLAVVSRTAVRPVPDPAGGTAHRVRTVLLDRATGRLTVDEHLRVRWCAARGWAALADVLVAPGAGARRAARLAAACPGALVVAVHRGDRCWTRLGPAGPVLAFRARGPLRPLDTWDRLASAAHTCLVAGLPPTPWNVALLAAVTVRGPGRAWDAEAPWQLVAHAPVGAPAPVSAGGRIGWPEPTAEPGNRKGR